MTFSLDGCVWAQYVTETGGGEIKGHLKGNALWFIPNGYRFKPHTPHHSFFNSLMSLSFAADDIHFTIDPVIISGTLRDNGFDQDGKAFGVGVTVNGATWSPGHFGYLVNGLGINNQNLLVTGSTLPTIKEAAATHLKWVCFGPLQQRPHDTTNSNHWQAWRYSIDRGDMDTQGCPDQWGAQVQSQMNEWKYGRERLNVTTTGRWGTKDPEVFNGLNTIRGPPYGAQLMGTETALEIQAEAALEEDYQLKVLYEYGNCQYNFSRDGAPTRVLPNVVPVGPSPGIPLKL